MASERKSKTVQLTRTVQFRFDLDELRAKTFECIMNESVSPPKPVPEDKDVWYQISNGTSAESEAYTKAIPQSFIEEALTLLFPKKMTAAISDTLARFVLDVYAENSDDDLFQYTDVSTRNKLDLLFWNKLRPVLEPLVAKFAAERKAAEDKRAKEEAKVTAEKMADWIEVLTDRGYEVIAPSGARAALASKKVGAPKRHAKASAVKKLPVKKAVDKTAPKPAPLETELDN